jgi:hypothetical protein
MKPLSNQQRLYQVNTEQLFDIYRSALGLARERLHFIHVKFQKQARFSKALRINRVPRPASCANVTTQALYDYEAAAGAHFLLELFGLAPPRAARCPSR